MTKKTIKTITFIIEDKSDRTNIRADISKSDPISLGEMKTFAHFCINNYVKSWHTALSKNKDLAPKMLPHLAKFGMSMNKIIDDYLCEGIDMLSSQDKQDFLLHCEDFMNKIEEQQNQKND